MAINSEGRTGNFAAYRYGSGGGGQEKDNEIYGVGNSYTAEYWNYDPRLGRRWNRDPVVYPDQSPYVAFNNNPIYFSDPLGLEGEGVETDYYDESGKFIETQDDGIDQSVTVNREQYLKAKDLAVENGIDLNTTEGAKEFNRLYSTNKLGLTYEVMQMSDGQLEIPANISINVNEMSALNANAILGGGYNYFAVKIPSGAGFFEGGRSYIFDSWQMTVNSGIGVELLSMGGGKGTIKLNVNNSFAQTMDAGFSYGVGYSRGAGFYKHNSFKSHYVDYSSHSLSIGFGFKNIGGPLSQGPSSLPGQPSTRSNGYISGGPVFRLDSAFQAILANDPNMYKQLSFSDDSVKFYYNLFFYNPLFGFK